jgi:L-fuconate dehydratase
MWPNAQVVYAIEEVAKRIIGMDVEKMFSDMGAFWEFCTSCVLPISSS